MVAVAAARNLRPNEHRISIVVHGKEISGWTDYEIETSLIEAADTWTLTRPRDIDAWRLCRRDASVKVLVDGLPRVVGYLGNRKTSSRAGTMTISGYNRAGRLVKESAPRSAYSAKNLVAVIEALAFPWFTKVTLSNAHNRRVQLGKGAKVAGDDQAIALIKGKRSTKPYDPNKAMFAKPSKNANRIDPGQSRWEVIEQICSRAGIAAWASVDGTELFIGQPNHDQAATFVFRHSSRGQSNVEDIEWEEDNDDRYSMITCVGSGISSAADYGEASSSRAGVVRDNPDIEDGTGRDFTVRKFLVLPEQGVADKAEAERVALREQSKRDFKRTHATITTWYHGQLLRPGGRRTLFGTDTIARVIDEDLGIDEDMLIYALTMRGSRDEGETTTVQAVPRGTELVA